MSTSPGKINLEDKINNLSNEEEKKWTYFWRDILEQVFVYVLTKSLHIYRKVLNFCAVKKQGFFPTLVATPSLKQIKIKPDKSF